MAKKAREELQPVSLEPVMLPPSTREPEKDRLAILADEAMAVARGKSVADLRLLIPRIVPETASLANDFISVIRRFRAALEVAEDLTQAEIINMLNQK